MGRVYNFLIFYTMLREILSGGLHEGQVALTAVNSDNFHVASIIPPRAHARKEKQTAHGAWRRLCTMDDGRWTMDDGRFGKFALAIYVH